MKLGILIADDHRLIREGLRSLLQRDPQFEVVGEAADGRSTVALTRELAPHVILMDVGMPDLNGVDATRQVKAEAPDVRVVALSAHAAPRLVSDMLGAGASAYVLKGSPFEELAAAIRTVADGHVYLTPQVASVVVNGYVVVNVGEGKGDDVDAGGGGAAVTVAASGERRGGGGALSPREREVLQLVSEGKNTTEIACDLHLSTKTVETHRRQVMQKLQIRSVAGLTRYAIREGVSSLDFVV